MNDNEKRQDEGCGNATCVEHNPSEPDGSKCKIFKGRDINGCEDFSATPTTSILAAELEELRLYRKEHERLKKELNNILHPNGDGPEKPSFCDLVAYVRCELKQSKKEPT